MVNENLCRNFKQAAEQHGLLESDDSIRQCLLEAATTRMPSALRRLFVIILVYCEPTGVQNLWDEIYPYMSEDYSSSSTMNNVLVLNRVFRDLNQLLQQQSKTISDYDIPEITVDLVDNSSIPKVIQDELSVAILEEDLNSVATLSSDQNFAFNLIVGAIESNQNAIFFVDGPGGIGTTYLYRALLASVRSQGRIAITIATSGITATLMPGGRTTHSRFKILLNPDSSSMCYIGKQSNLAELIRRATVVISDETMMTNRYAFEALNRTFIDIIGVDLPFGGKIMVFGGDFRQVLPVGPRGDGVQLTIEDDMIQIPMPMAILWDGEESINQLIEEVYPDISNHAIDGRYMVDRGIITHRNEDVDRLNDRVILRFLGQTRVYYSFDEVENDQHNLYQQEFLNSISPRGMPPHMLKLKDGAPNMLLRNIDPSIGLCNGTRLLCRSLNDNFIDCEILASQFKGTRAFLPRIPLKTPKNVTLPFEMTRRQFPIRLSFALMINKLQWQTIPSVGIYLPDHIFSHGQLYVALSRGVLEQTTKVLVKNGLVHNTEEVHTRNVVYKDVLLPNHY